MRLRSETRYDRDVDIFIQIFPLWDFLRNDALQKFQPRFHNKTPLKQNQFGFVTGGPVFLPKIYDGRNHTFFLVSYNGGRRATGSNGVAQVPTAAEKQGDFGTWPTQLFDPLSSMLTPGASLPVSRAPFAGNQIPIARFAPQSSNLIKYWPAQSFACQAELDVPYLDAAIWLLCSKGGLHLTNNELQELNKAGSPMVTAEAAGTD